MEEARGRRLRRRGELDLRHVAAAATNVAGGVRKARETAQQMADMRQQKMTQCRAYRQHRLAQEGEGIAEKAQPCGTRRSVDKGDEKSRRQAEAARQPEVFRTGARHHPREGGKEMGLRQHCDAAHEHR